MNNTECSAGSMGKIMKEAEERVNKEIERLFLDRIERIKDINSKEASRLFYEMQEMDHSLRVQEMKKYPELAGTDFLCDKVFLLDKKEPVKFNNAARTGIFGDKNQEGTSWCGSFFYASMVFWGWFALAVVMGWMLSHFFTPPEFFLDFYSNYNDYIDKYELFCLSMMVVIFSFPLFFWLFYLVFFKDITWHPLSTKVVLNMLAFVMLIHASGINELGHIKGGKADIRILFVQLFDWGGGVLINIFFFSFLVLAIMTGLKSKESQNIR